jgi:hypothetical protein
MIRLPLFDSTPLQAGDVPAAATLEERAAAFHARNPQVLRMAVDLARYAKSRGAKRYSIGAIWEVLRFRALETIGDKYKLNNSYRAWYARTIMARYPDLAGFLATRESKHDPDFHTKEPRQ